ncbi:MAG TPA: di-trans,poly-cis-decaprenylcistransferase, partial [Rhizobiales bacterium]|nr:di-trans,poly-cis-decaprenylcistransferase [Hyphomicrobiales bacterium]
MTKSCRFRTLSGLSSHTPGAECPRHIAIIMDGNGRWANARGRPRLYGHQQGVNTVRRIV